MYQHCIFCSANLKSNPVVEWFPVGRVLAFDAARGRLWAVCPKCARWNLAPIEERWEAVEACERLFRATSLRVQAENVGLAKLPDGTRLVRVGDALPTEEAAWRYGREMVERNTRALRRRRWEGAGSLGIGAAALASLAAGPVAIPFLVAGHGLYAIVEAVGRVREPERLVHRIRPSASPTGELLEVRRRHLSTMSLHETADGDFALRLVDWEVRRPFRLPPKRPERRLTLPGSLARPILRRALPLLNATGAQQPFVEGVLQRIQREGGSRGFLRWAAASGRSFVPYARMGAGPYYTVFSPAEQLGLEIALQEQEERRALRGELVLLRAAWREAEEIAGIADALPDEPPPPPR